MEAILDTCGWITFGIFVIVFCGVVSATIGLYLGKALVFVTDFRSKDWYMHTMWQNHFDECCEEVDDEKEKT